MHARARSHGPRRDLTAWQVFAPGGADATLSRAEWQLVLGLVTGGLGMSATETEHLFKAVRTHEQTITEVAGPLDALHAGGRAPCPASVAGN